MLIPVRTPRVDYSFRGFKCDWLTRKAHIVETVCYILIPLSAPRVDYSLGGFKCDWVTLKAHIVETVC